MMKKAIQTIIIAVLTLCIVIGALFLMPESVRAEKMDRAKITVKIDGTKTAEIDGYEANYENNFYISLRSLAKALSGTAKQYQFYRDAEGTFMIRTGLPYDYSQEPAIQTENGAAVEIAPEETAYLGRLANWTNLDGRDVTYYSFADYTTEDLYVSLLNAQLMFDLNVQYSDGIYLISTDKHFQADLDKLNAQGYFDYLHGALLGDATTGEILFSCHGNDAVPIASTTKLMTYLIVKRMEELGRLKDDDLVTVTANAARLSVSDDAVLYMYEGEKLTVHDLICAMMIVSSNESALALAEHVAGSKEQFVSMMNAMAFRLGLTSARFYNPHGLPEFYPGDVTTMVENRMSAKDLFKLARTVLLKYPEIEEITSVPSMWLESFWTTVNTTNSLLHNMPDLIGLKTGTTDAAEKCLVSARRVKTGGEEHILVAVVLGAEFNYDRVEMSELLLKSQGY